MALADDCVANIMLNFIIDFSLRNRLLVISVVVLFGVAGAFALANLDIDAFPDTTPIQVQINTTAPALGPEEVESQLTAPIEQALGGMPRLALMRSTSKFGLSQVVVTFQEGTDIYFARQLVNERLSGVVLPDGIERPVLGPVATGLGEVFHYIVTLKGWDFSRATEHERIEKLTYLRTLHDWSIKTKLRTVPGVAEVNSWGGYEKQYQVRVEPERLVKHDLTFMDVVEAMAQNNRNVGGGGIRQNNQFLLIQGSGHGQPGTDRQCGPHRREWCAGTRQGCGGCDRRARDSSRGRLRPRPGRSGSRPVLHDDG